MTRLDHAPDQAIVAVVGDGMKGRPGVAGKVFGALGRHNINISAIAQGASERNISCVIDAAQQVRALNVIHQAFFEKRRRLALAVIGVGNIGGALLRQLHQQRSYLLSKGFDVPVVGLANSKRFVLSADGINLAHWKEELAASRRRMRPGGVRRRRRAYGADQRGAGRLHGGRFDRGRLSGLHRCEPAHRHAEQAGERAAVAALSRVEERLLRTAEALPVRGQRRRRPAGHVDAARS